MPKITSVESQKKNLKRFNIFLDHEFAFGADEDLVVNRRLVVGKILAQEDVEKILFEAEVGRLMEKMYRLWRIRQRSEKEVRDYLKIRFKKEISQLAEDALVENLKRKNMINDLGFARAWTEARRRSRQKGARVIKGELIQKGVAKEIIEEVIGQKNAQSEADLAREALEKKIKYWKNLDLQKFKQKSCEFLMRKGFDYELCKSTVEKILQKE